MTFDFLSLFLLDTLGTFSVFESELESESLNSPESLDWLSLELVYTPSKLKNSSIYFFALIGINEAVTDIIESALVSLGAFWLLASVNRPRPLRLRRLGFPLCFIAYSFSMSLDLKPGCTFS